MKRSFFGRRGLFALGLVLAFVGSLAAIVYWRSESVLARDFSPSEDALRLSNERPDANRVERGRRLAVVIAQCDFCHGSDLSGKEVVDDPWLGRLHAGNLTPGSGGIGRNYSDADWVRAIRFGARRNGRSLLLMPTANLSAISDGDLSSLIAYLREVRPVATSVSSMRVGWAMRLALALGVEVPDLFSALAVDRSRRAPRDVPVEPTVEYGAYLVAIGNCRFCHGSDLRGGLHPLARPGEPAPSDLTLGGAMLAWDRDDFARAMRRGLTPEGRQLDREYMPWPGFAGLEDLEIDALWSYLRERRADRE